MSVSFTTLVIGGGGVKGISELGALEFLAEKNLLKNIDTFVGTSAGSIICVLLSIGYEPIEILNYIIQNDEWSKFDTQDILTFQKTGGLMDICHIIRHIETLIKRKLKFIPTLKEMFEISRKHVIITTTNITKQRSEKLDHENSPNVSVLGALTMSCSIPVIFKRFEHNGCFYVDGGILDNFPLEFAVKNNTENLNPKNISNTKVFAICVESENDPHESILNFINACSTLPSIMKQRSYILKFSKEKYKDQIKILNIGIGQDKINVVDFNLDKDTKMKMFVEGYKQCEKLFLLEKSVEHHHPEGCVEYISTDF